MDAAEPEPPRGSHSRALRARPAPPSEYPRGCVCFPSYGPVVDENMPSAEALRAHLWARFERPLYGQLDVPDAWLPLLVELDQAIAALAPDYRVRQVKSKFGALSVHLGHIGGTAEIQEEVLALVRAAEQASYGWPTDGPHRGSRC